MTAGVSPPRRAVAKSALCALLAACVLAGPRASMAQTRNKAAAEALFEEGKKLAAERRYAAACAKFEASQELDAALGTLLHLADCYDRIGKTASAWALFKEAASAAATSGQEQRSSIAKTRAAALAPRLTKLVVVPPAHRASGLRVTLNGTLVTEASWGIAVPVDPGVHVIRASAPSHHPWTRQTRLSGEGKSWSIEIPELASAPIARKPLRDVSGPTPPLAYKDSARDARAGTTQRVWGGVAAAFGLVALSAGGVLAFVADRKYNDSLDECRQTDRSLCTPTGVAERQEAKDYALASAVALGGGGALLITGLVLYVSAPSAEVTRQARVTPDVRRRGAALVWETTW